MLSFQQVSSSGQAAHYFESADDYYAKEGHRGEWLGKGAQELSLTNQAQVERDTFKNVLDGKLPNGLVVRFADQRSDDRKGMDYTFSAPKSVSLQALIAQDDHVLHAHDRAVRRAVQQLEKLAHGRVKEGGQSYRVHTGVIVAAAFRHELSRAQDPQLHTHVVVANVTKRPDGQWRALSNDDIQANILTLGAYYRAALGEELRAAGYELRETGKGYWELAHVSDDLIKHYSTRAQQIEAAFEARGQSRETASTGLAQAVTLMTRESKTEVDRTALREEWLASAQRAGLSLSSLVSAQAAANPTPDVDALRLSPEARAAASNAVDFAIEHLSERQGLYTRRELVEQAMNKGATTSSISAVMKEVSAAETDGRLVRELPLYQTARSINLAKSDSNEAKFMDAPETAKLTRASWIGAAMHTKGLTEAQATVEIDKAIKRGALVASEARYTTPKAQQVERRILAIERDGRGAVQPIQSVEAIAAKLAKSDLNEGQREAVTMILSSNNRFSAVQGYAGTGKSHMLKQAFDQITKATGETAKQEGHTVIGLAPYASQVAALKELGVESNTLASFLHSKKAQGELNHKTIVVLDEAGVVPAHQLANIMGLVEKAGARMVMLGDRKQTGAVEAGKPFAQLQDAGMLQAQLREIQRQKEPELKAAVINAANDQTTNALKHLASRIIGVEDASKRYDEISKAYLRQSPDQRKQTLIVAGTNEARREINARVREGLKLPEGRQFAVLEAMDATRAELKQASTYAKDLVVAYHRESGSIKRDQLYNVEGQGEGLVKLRDEQGTIHEVQPKLRHDATLYRKEQITLAPGDVVRVTKTDRGLGLHNGDRVQVTGVSPGHLTVETDKGKRVSIPADRPMHVQHGYATTVHSSQGLTANRVLIDANTRSLTTNRAAFYVAISRPRNDLRLFTNDPDGLRKAVDRVPKKFAALELRTAYSEEQISQQKHRLIAVNNLRRIKADLVRKSTHPTPVEPNRSVTMGRKVR